MIVPKDMTRPVEFLGDHVFSLLSRAALSSGIPAWVVGGYVRDCYLGRGNKDVDVVVKGDPSVFASALSSILSEGGKRTKVTEYTSTGTLLVRVGGYEVEIVPTRAGALRRGQNYVPGMELPPLEVDQSLRDLTINSMALGLGKDDWGRLYDPYGGLADLARGILRTPVDAHRTFMDDPLRMVRAARFASTLSTPSLPFTLDEATHGAVFDLAPSISDIPVERVRAELDRILLSPVPSIGFRVLDATGLLRYIMPEVCRLKGVQTVEGRGHKDIFAHTLGVLDNVASIESGMMERGELRDYRTLPDGTVESCPRTEPNLYLRWAALLHDIGKPATKKYDPQRGWTFMGHPSVGAKMVKRIFTSLKLPLDDRMAYVTKLVFLHHRPMCLSQEEVTDSAIRRLLFDAGNDIDDLMVLCDSDITSKNPRKVAMIRENFELVREKLQLVEQKDALRNWKNPLDGNYIMDVYGIGPSNVIGLIKEAVKEAILDGKVEYSFEAADAYMREIAPSLGLVARK